MVNPPESSVNLKNRLQTILKSAQISDQPGVLENYARDYSFHPLGSPSLVVYPGTKEEVQAIVRLAGETRTPLVPVSSGPPRFHGDTIPEQGGIMVDFSRMNKIRKISTPDRYAWIEPGVTYGELMPELKKQGLKLVSPLLPRANKSVVASRLEREPVIIPKYQYDFIDPLLTLEVIYGTGEEFRTGSASGPGTLETLKADKVNPWGPGSVDYFRFISGAQGTMGLVTWAITKVEVIPALQKLYFVTHQDLKVLTDVMNQLLRKRVVDECLALNNVNLAAMLAHSWPDDFKKLKKDLPPWTLILCLAGYKRRPDERIAIMEKYLHEVCQSFGVRPLTTLPGVAGKEKEILDLLSGPDSGETYWKLRYKGACHDLFFLSTVSRASEFTAMMQKTAARHKYPREDIGAYIQPMVQGRGCHCEFNLFCDESNKAERDEVKKLFTDASETLLKNGAFFTRPYGLWAKMVYDCYPEQVKALKKLKGIFDPHNILNPGKLCF
jgi:FAD/FMN-containing dehydrogenase